MPQTDCSLVFPPDPLWVRSARQAVRTLLAAVDASELADTAELLTSEVVTNAINACRSSGCSAPLTVYAKYSGALRVLVHDETPGRPMRRAPTEVDENGRGITLIDACAAEWGVCRYGPGPGKTVWFELLTRVESNRRGRAAAVERMRQMVTNDKIDFSKIEPCGQLCSESSIRMMH